MGVIDMLLLLLYIVAIGCSVFIIHSHRSYYQERFKVGVVSVFMLAMLFFLASYTFKMLIVLLMRSAVVFDFASQELSHWLLYGWTAAQIGTTAGLISLAWLTWRKRYDLFLFLRRVDKRGEDKVEQD
ncbi:hypothetical protein [Paenibacillus brevis]|uniref:Uncharacterized protein n=1 Tax=Paenibacillus brevis TaxID=2841508 RepID=A0ABS6FTF2_9BACL|nr:hypothetical protein [Paenibacillus brevis]MBU5673264.1 hypothetical protein [Paenibacillus brevis]